MKTLQALAIKSFLHLSQVSIQNFSTLLSAKVA